jgi:hypothetical protein
MGPPSFTEYLDDRGWGDLVQGTFNEFPPPAVDVLAMVTEIVGDLPPAIQDRTSAEALRTVRQAYDTFDRSRSQDPGQVAGG